MMFEFENSSISVTFTGKHAVQSISGHNPSSILVHQSIGTDAASITSISTSILISDQIIFNKQPIME